MEHLKKYTTAPVGPQGPKGAARPTWDPRIAGLVGFSRFRRSTSHNVRAVKKRSAALGAATVRTLQVGGAAAARLLGAANDQDLP